MRVLTRLCGVLFLFPLAMGLRADGPATATLSLRGREQTLRLYGDRASDEVAIVSSGDGGWIHLAPHVAETLAARGFFVVGLDTRSYLESFTSGHGTLRPEDEPGDYRTLIDFANGRSAGRALLVGVSEGAGLSVLAATDPRTRERLQGVVALGLPNINELGWRWKDSLIYVTHSVPNEPTFSSAAVIDKVAPFPLAAIHSTNDEFVPVAEVKAVLARARPPTRLWLVDASNHRFSSNLPDFDQRLMEAVAWVSGHQPR